MAQKKLCLFVLGMHRSGTSALTGGLKIMGINLGANLMAANEFNPKGYFEHNDVVRLNDKILDALDSKWDDVFLLPKGWEHFPVLDSLKKEIRHFILSEFSENKLFAIKDPRLCLTLPLWQEVLNNLGIEHRYLIMVRDPEEISHSLAKREGFSTEKSYLLWATSAIAIEKNTRALSRIYIHYQDNLLKEPLLTFSNIIDQCKLPVSIDEHREQLLNFLDPQLKHHSSTGQKLNQLPDYITALKDRLYSLTQNKKEQNTDHQELNLLHETIRQNIRFYYHQELVSKLHDYTDVKKEAIQKQIQINNLSIKNNQLEQEIRLKYQEIKTKEEHLKDKYEQLSAVNNLIISRDHQIRLLREELNLRQEQLQQEKHRQEQQLTPLTAEINSAKEKLSLIYQDMAFLQNKLKEKEGFIKEAQEQFRAYENQFNALEKEYKLKQAHVEDLESYVFSLTREIKDLKSSLSLRIGKIISAPIRLPYDWLVKGSGKESNLLSTGAKMAVIGLSSPFQLIRQLNVKNFRTLRDALKNESPSTIINNFQQLLSPGSMPPNIEKPVKKISTIKETNEKELFSQKKKKELSDFLASGQVLTFPEFKEPQVSILLLFYNRAELSLDCLKSILKNVRIPYEVIIVDNASADETGQLLSSIKGAKIIKNTKNAGFVDGCNQAAKHAIGKYLLFLNNDTYLYENSLKAAWETIENTEKCGAVGGKILLLDGKLQEAGSIVWQDGSCLGYGRNEDPDNPQFMFRREVDFCSGAFLLTPARLFSEIGGFNTTYSPAYYEEVDYCMNLHKKGYKVIYEPDAVIKHFEFASSSSSDNAIQLQIKNRKTFCLLHKTQLENHFIPTKENILEARFSSTVKNKKKILYIDDRVPHIDTGSGFPRSNLILNSLVNLGYQVTMLPLNFPKEESWHQIYRDIDKKIEVITGTGRRGFIQFLESRAGFYDMIWVSRPHNMSFFNKHLEKVKACFPQAKIIYDAEAIFANREFTFAQLKENAKAIDDSKAKMAEELSLAQAADLIITVTEGEKKSFLNYGYKNAEVLDVAFDIVPTKNKFQDREGLLFVGNLDYDESPNVDSLVWFIEEVYPLITKQIGDIPLHIVGSNKSAKINALGKKNPNIRLHGKVPQLYDYFNRARLFIAPTRYAAGSPAKVWQAAAFGLPTIATELIMNQLGWEKGREIEGATWKNPKSFADALLKLYSSADLWYQFHERLIEKMKREASPESYFSKVKKIVRIMEGGIVKNKENTIIKSTPLPVKNNGDKYFFIHIQKTAGSSFINTLSQIFPLDSIYANSKHLKANNKSYPSYKQYLSLDHHSLENIKLLVGHIPFVFRDIMPASPYLLVFLRHPIERVISNLLYKQKFLGQEDLPVETVYRNIKNELSNLQVRYFADNDLNKLSFFHEINKPIDRMTFKKAKENLNQCHFIGITEEFEISIKIANKIFGWNLSTGARVNVNKSKDASLIPEHILEEIYENNKLDLEFYEYALSLFEKMKSKHLGNDIPSSKKTAVQSF